MASSFDPNAPDIVLKSLFLKYDTDNSGHLGSDELKTLFKDDLALTEDQAQMYALLLDRDGSKNVSFEEFRNWMRSGEYLQNMNDKSRFSVIKQAVDMFKKYDADGSQALDRQEFEKVLVDCGSTPEVVDGALQALDSDGNGTISFLEFLKWLNWVPMDSFE